MPRFTGGWTLFGGCFKSLVYGTIVASVACHRAYTASGGARGVGRAVTLAAVYTNLYIVIANYSPEPSQSATDVQDAARRRGLREPPGPRLHRGAFSREQ